jgi:hypothetical protein
MGLYASLVHGDRFAILSSVFYGVPVHYVKDASGQKFVRCLAPEPCALCQKKFAKGSDRFGAFIYDYQEKGQFPIKAWCHQLSSVNKFFYGITVNKGLQSMDFVFTKKKGEKNDYTSIQCKEGILPEWYRNFPEKVMKLWEDYQEDHIISMICRDLDYPGQLEFIKEINAGVSGAAPTAHKNIVGDFLSGKTKKVSTVSDQKKTSQPRNERQETKPKNNPKVPEEPEHFAMQFDGIPEDLLP